MAKRFVNKGVTVVREGKRVRPEVGKNFDFTADEIERITEVEPLALTKATDAAEEGEATTASTTAKTTTTTDKPAASGQTKAAKAAAKKAAAAKPAAKPAAKTPEGDSDAELGDGEGGEGGDAGDAGDDDL